MERLVLNLFYKPSAGGCSPCFGSAAVCGSVHVLANKFNSVFVLKHLPRPGRCLTLRLIYRRRRSSASLSGSSSSSSSSRSRSPPKKPPKRTVSSPPRKTRRLSPSASPPRRRHRPSPPASPPPKPRRSPTPQQSNRARKSRGSVSPGRASGKK